MGDFLKIAIIVVLAIVAIRVTMMVISNILSMAVPVLIIGAAG